MLSEKLVDDRNRIGCTTTRTLIALGLKKVCMPNINLRIRMCVVFSRGERLIYRQSLQHITHVNFIPNNIEMNKDRSDNDSSTMYRWEQGMSKTWESVQEDDEGNIVTIDRSKERAERAQNRRITDVVRRGLIRYSVLAIDCSTNALDRDLRPSRLEVCKSAGVKFIREYFDQNPISQLGILIMKDGKVEKLSEMSGNMREHVRRLQGFSAASGVASLQNGLILSMNMLRHTPSYGTREIILLFNSLSSCDPGNIFDTADKMKDRRIRCSIVCTGGEVYVCKAIATSTRGEFQVAMDSSHLTEILLGFSLPPPEENDSRLPNGQTTAVEGSYLYMGFPKRVLSERYLFGFASSLDSDSDGKRQNALSGYSNIKMMRLGYLCPRCGCRVSDIPSSCNVCGLLLNSSAHIARTHHHLVPVPNFEEVAVSVETASSTPVHCSGCLSALSDDEFRTKCPTCSRIYCADCDIFIHDQLRICPGDCHRQEAK